MIDLWKLIGIIVHSQHLQILVDRVFYGIVHAQSKLTYLAGQKGRGNNRIDPVCDVRSDKSAAEFFVADFAERCGTLLETTREQCSEFGMHIGYDYDL